MAGSGSARRRRLCSPPPLPRAGAAERRHWPLPPCLSRGQAAADPLSRGSPAPDPHLVVENHRRFLPRATAAPPSLRRRPLRPFPTQQWRVKGGWRRWRKKGGWRQWREKGGGIEEGGRGTVRYRALAFRHRRRRALPLENRRALAFCHRRRHKPLLEPPRAVAREPSSELPPPPVGRE